MFDPPTFYLLSGLPHPNPGKKHNHISIELTSEEREELEALYDTLVCIEKVKSVYAKISAGIPEGPSLPDFNKKSEKCVERLHAQVSNSIASLR